MSWVATVLCDPTPLQAPQLIWRIVLGQVNQPKSFFPVSLPGRWWEGGGPPVLLISTQRHRQGQHTHSDSPTLWYEYKHEATVLVPTINPPYWLSARALQNCKSFVSSFLLSLTEGWKHRKNARLLNKNEEIINYVETCTSTLLVRVLTTCATVTTQGGLPSHRERERELRNFAQISQLNKSGQH